MQIKFDPTYKIAGIGLVPWSRIGPEQWFPNYRIASLYGWDAAGENVPSVVSAGPLVAARLRSANTAHLLKDSDFSRLLTEELLEYDLLTYKAVTPPEALQGRKFLMPDPRLTTQLENKVEFRRLCSKIIRMPAFAVYERADLRSDETGFREVCGDREAVVLQDEQLSGGRGTWIVRSFAEYTRALKELAELSHATRVVVSDLIENAKERTIQACVTKQGVFTGPLQRQIIKNPLLANLTTLSGDKFCGAQIIAAEQGSPLHNEMAATAKQIGEMLQERGYRGIFGLDCLVDTAGIVYAIEINPRTTGVTPLLTSLYGPAEGVPFYALHLLELGGYPYEITDDRADFTADGALLLLHAHAAEQTIFDTALPSGTYTFDERGGWERISDGLRLSEAAQGQWIVQQYMPDGSIIKAGGRVLTLQYKGVAIDPKTDKLTTNTEAAVRAAYVAVGQNAID